MKRTLNKRKICIITSSRTDYTRLKTVMTELKKKKNVELVLIVAGSHLLEKYGRTIQDIYRDGFHVDQKAYVIVEGENPTTMAKSVGLAMIEYTTIFNNYQPDIVVIHGDRYENFAAGVAAAMMNIVVAHIQGGEVSGTIDETIRHALTKIAHIHFPSSALSKKRILKLGENPAHVFNVGCPATDLLLQTNYGTKKQLLLESEIRPKDGRSFDYLKPYALAILHPVTTEYKDANWQMTEFLRAIDMLNMQTILLYPNVDAGSEDMITAIRRYMMRKPLPHVFMYKNIYHKTFMRVIAHSSLILGNSSVGIRESCYFGIPTVNVGTREQRRERGINVINAHGDHASIYRAALRQLRHGKYPIQKIYGTGDAGKKIATILSTFGLKNFSPQKTITY